MTKRNTTQPSQQQLQRAAQIPWTKIGGVLLDWAGTTIDFGSMAPVEVVREVFHEYGIDVTEAEARQPMGKAKIDHLREVLNIPRVAELWKQIHGTPFEEQNVRALYEQFLERQKAVLVNHSDLVPGTKEFVEFLRSQEIKIGSTTGYTRDLLEVILPLAAKAGFSPDTSVCSDEVATGRPAPWSNFRAAELIGVYPMNRVLVVDDSIAGVMAGKNAGCHAVAVTTTGNPFGMSYNAFLRLEDVEVDKRHRQAEAEFYAAGADLVVQSVSVLHDLWQTSI